MSCEDRAAKELDQEAPDIYHAGSHRWGHDAPPTVCLRAPTAITTQFIVDGCASQGYSINGRLAPP